MLLQSFKGLWMIFVIHLSNLSIDDVLVFSKSIDQHFKHLNIFLDVTQKNGLIVSQKKMSLLQMKNRFLGHYVFQGTISLIERVI